MSYSHGVFDKDAAAAAAKSLQSCPSPCDPIDGSPPGSPVPGILQARIPEWGAIAFSVDKDDINISNCIIRKIDICHWDGSDSVKVILRTERSHLVEMGN